MPSNSLARKLLFYGLGTGAVTVTSTTANADIVYSGPVEFSGNTIYFDLQNVTPPAAAPSADHDFNLSVKTTKSKAKVNGYGSNTPGVSSVIRGMAGRTYALQYPALITIGDDETFTPGGYFNNFYGGGPGGPAGEGLGDWTAGERGFLGLRITVAGMNLFGWADVTLNNFTGTGVGAFTLHGYAYENTGVPIQTGAIPEPSTIALLATGAAGVLALRRRKKQ